MTDLKPVHHTTCRICHADLVPILSLGEQYLSDFPASADTKAYPPVPLDLVRCENPKCGLVQLAHTTPREWLYSQYWYRSGVNESMRAELRDVVEGGLRYLDTRKPLIVADIGANDGTLLSMYPQILGDQVATRIAWEPAKNLYEACRPHAEVLFPDFFHAPAREWHGNVHLLTMIACFYDIEDPHALVGDVCNLLNKQGVWIIQQAYLPDMLDASGYDNIGHEHLEYYHLHPLEGLLASHGLEVFAVEHRAINGGSFRTYVGWKGRHPVEPSVGLMRALEVPLLVHAEDHWLQFAERVAARISELREGLAILHNAGNSVDIYGASTKGSTLLQTCGIDARTIRQCWERSPEKYGRYYGVTGIPIVPEAEGRADPPAALLVLPWGFKESFVAREQDYLKAGGKLIFPLPTVEVVGG
jgi:hypothetical protein